MGFRDGYRFLEVHGAAELRWLRVGRILLGILVGGIGLGIQWLAANGGLVFADGRPFPAILVAGLAAGFGLVATGLLFYRSGVRFDRQAGQVTTWWGIPKPWARTAHALDAFAEVQLRKEVRRTGQNGGTQTYYPVELCGDTKLVIASPRHALRARRLAEQVARACHMPLRNALAGTPVVRQPDQLDQSLRQRRRAAGDLHERPMLPPETRLSTRMQGDVETIAIPALGWLRGGLVLLALVLPGVIAGIGFLAAFADGAPPAFQATLLAGLGLPLVALLAVVAHRSYRRTTLDISTQELRITQHRLLGRSTRVLPVDEIEEVTSTVPTRRHPLFGDFLPGGAVTVLSDQLIVRFGIGLDDDDLTCLVALVEYGLCGPGSGSGDDPLASGGDSSGCGSSRATRSDVAVGVGVGAST